MAIGDAASMRTCIIFAVLIVFGIVTFALAAATLGTVNRRYDDLENAIRQQRLNTTPRPPINSTLARSIHVQDAMVHLNALQRIATTNNETRAIITPGFARTVDYIRDTLRNSTNFNVTTRPFLVRQFELASTPILAVRFVSSGNVINYTYSTDPSLADFYQVRYSISGNIPTGTSIVAIANFGCSANDWNITTIQNSVALIKRGGCTFAEKGALAAKYTPLAILFYNDGNSSNPQPPIEVSLGQANNLSALFLSYTAGEALAAAVRNNSVVNIEQMFINVKDSLSINVDNVCADTLTGAATETIIIGSHSDSVPAGPGINDNGSGSAANLALALTLSRLLRTTNYLPYRYRVRFCWWGAEEVGLLGSEDHVKQAKLSTTVGERLQDYLINLNYDMLGSPNFIFGIYNGQTARNDTPPVARPGSNKITALFRDWFISQNLPWDYTQFDGRSDYGPFLAQGIPAGGLFSGADATKTQEQQLRYERILGQGMGGAANLIQDPCYHKSCDTVQNINVFAYEKMIQAAAFMLEHLGRQTDLRAYLNSGVRVDQNYKTKRPYPYDSINEYFRLPYL